MFSSLLAMTLACSSTPTAAGGLGAGSQVGAPPGSPCQTTWHKQGCTSDGFGGSVRVECSAVTGTWIQIQACGFGQQCVELPDPASPTSGLRVSECQVAGGVVDAAADPTDGSGSDAGAGQDVHTLKDIGGDAPLLDVAVGAGGAQEWAFDAEPADGGPSKVLVRVSNGGSAKLTLGAISLQTTNAYMGLEFPDPKPTFPIELAALASVKLYVVYAPPPGKFDLAPGTLTVTPQGGKPAPATVPFTVKAKKKPLTVLCDDSAVTPTMDFTGVTKGKVQRSCTVINGTDQATTFIGWALAPKDTANKATVSETLGLDVFVLGPEGQKLIAAPFDLSAGGKMVYAVTFYAPADGKRADATLQAPWKRGTDAGTLSIAVLTEPGG